MYTKKYDTNIQQQTTIDELHATDLGQEHTK